MLEATVMIGSMRRRLWRRIKGRDKGELELLRPTIASTSHGWAGVSARVLLSSRGISASPRPLTASSLRQKDVQGHSRR